MPESEPLAIVGMACRFPGGANSPEAFWTLLRDGIDAITEVPAERWNASRFFHPNSAAPGRMVTRWGGFVENADAFDAAFFGIAPREASRMDPQQRWLLETTWEAIEDGGLAPEHLRVRSRCPRTVSTMHTKLMVWNKDGGNGGSESQLLAVCINSED